MAGRIGAMRETLTIQTPTPETFAVTSVTRASALATVTTKKAHGFIAGDYVTIAGAGLAGYNGEVQVLTTPSTTTFTYAVDSGLATPATGTITAAYFSDAQGGRAEVWRDLVTIRAEQVPIRVAERLQAQALQAQLDLRFRARVRADVTAAMRASWTPSWPRGAAARSLEIHGVLPVNDGRQYMFLECGALV